MLGHTDAEFTMNTYMHVTDSMQENVANTMGNLLGGNAAFTKFLNFSLFLYLSICSSIYL